MTDEDITRIRGRSPQARYLMRDGALTTEASHDMSRLLAEVERLRAAERQTDGLLERVQDGEMALAQENAALREIAAKIAAVPDDDYDEACPFCKESPGYTPVRHTPECPVTMARHLLDPKVQPHL